MSDASPRPIDRLIGIMANDTLLAVPFFTFMGLVLERSGMAEDLLDTIGQLFGPVRGGLAFAVIFVGALLALYMGAVNWVEIILAWTFVTLRYVHAAVHVTTNNVEQRFAAYAAGLAVLLLFWLWLIIRILMS